MVDYPLILNWIKKHNIVLVAFIMSCVGMLLRIVNLYKRDLWHDEVYQVHCMQMDIKPFWMYQNYGDHSSFPGEYLLNNPFILRFGVDKWGLAIPHILVNILGFFLLYKVGRYYFKTWVGYFMATTIYAFNSQLLFHSFEFRPYAVLPVLALASIYGVHRLSDQDRSWNKIDTLMAGALVIMAVNYHIYGLAIFFLPLLYVVLVHWKQNSCLPGQQKKFLNHHMSRGDIFILVLCTLAALGVWVWFAAFNNWGFSPNLAQSIRETFDYIANPAEKPFAFFKTVICSLVGNRLRAVFLFSIVLTLILPVGKKFEQFVFAVLLILLPIALVLYADLKSHYWFLDRQYVWVIPFASIFLGWQWDNIYCFVRQKIGLTS